MSEKNINELILEEVTKINRHLKDMSCNISEINEVNMRTGEYFSDFEERVNILELKEV